MLLTVLLLLFDKLLIKSMHNQVKYKKNTYNFFKKIFSPYMRRLNIYNVDRKVKKQVMVIF